MFCVGDCNQNNTVTVDELLTMVNIALGNGTADLCPFGDANADAHITIDEILSAVNNALSGCHAGALATPTATAGSSSTPGAAVRLVAGESVLVVDAMSVIPQVIAALVNGVQSGTSAAFVPAVAMTTSHCLSGGTVTRLGSFPFISIGLVSCGVPTSDGTAVYTGTIGISLTAVSMELSMQFLNHMNQIISSSDANITGVLTTPVFGGDCFLTALNFTVTSGNVDTLAPDATTVGLSFQGTTVAIDDVTFTGSCVPEEYTLTFQGPAVLLTPTGTPLDVALTSLALHVDAHSDPTVLDLSGGISSACFGGEVMLDTIESLNIASGAICPTRGDVTVKGIDATVPFGNAEVFFRSTGAVDIDSNGDGLVDDTAPNCLDARLLMCAA